jgi:hypothetical protein
MVCTMSPLEFFAAPFLHHIPSVHSTFYRYLFSPTFRQISFVFPLWSRTESPSQRKFGVLRQTPLLCWSIPNARSGTPPGLWEMPRDQRRALPFLPLCFSPLPMLLCSLSVRFSVFLALVVFPIFLLIYSHTTTDGNPISSLRARCGRCGRRRPLPCGSRVACLALLRAECKLC